MEVTLRKLGNSTGIAFPAAMLKELGLKVGQPLTMTATAEGGVTLTPKRRYTLAELMAQCDFKARAPADLAIWDASISVGSEKI
jgi:antitoxin ChpS